MASAEKDVKKGLEEVTVAIGTVTVQAASAKAGVEAAAAPVVQKTAHDDIKIKHPMFFKLEYKGKTFFILGTEHDIKLKHFDEVVLNQIKKTASYLSLEHRTDVPIDGDQLSGQISASYDQDWKKKLSETTKTKLGAERLDCQHPILLYLQLELFESTTEGMEYDLLALFPDQKEDLSLEALSSEGVIEELESAIKDYTDRFTIKQQEYNANPQLKASYPSFYDFLFSELMAKREKGYYVDLTDPETVEYFTLDLLTTKISGDSNKHMQNQGYLKRNIAWSNKIETLTKGDLNHILFAVGADHLRKSTGVLALLEEKGFKISRINPSGQWDSISMLKIKMESEAAELSYAQPPVAAASSGVSAAAPAGVITFSAGAAVAKPDALLLTGAMPAQAAVAAFEKPNRNKL